MLKLETIKSSYLNMYVIDAQGFNFGSSDDFICKEICILDTANGSYLHKFVGTPISQINNFNEKTINHLNFLTNNVHGIYWTDFNRSRCKDTNHNNRSCSSKEEEEEGGDVIYPEELYSFITNNVDPSSCVLVINENIKKWLARFMNNNIINYNDDDECCLRLKKLKLILRSHHCIKHTYNNLNCSLENAFHLYYWYSYFKK